MRRITFGCGFSPTLGTPDYMAPEQVKGQRGDERTDIYSLGAVLYEMTTGSVPFEGANPFIVMNSRITGDPMAPRKRNPAIPEEVEEIILHAMEREPHRRYASATAMKAELDNLESVKLTGRAESLQARRKRVENALAGNPGGGDLRADPDRFVPARLALYAWAASPSLIAGSLGEILFVR